MKRSSIYVFQINRLRESHTKYVEFFRNLWFFGAKKVDEIVTL